MSTITNSVRLIGRLGTDPEVRQIGVDKKVAHFTIATHDHYRDAAGQKIEKTCWHNLTAWNAQAEVVEKYLRKGHQVAVEGKINNYSYTSQDGQKKFVQEIIVHQIQLLESAPEPVSRDTPEDVPF